jgi:flagellar basal-body rod modification protein FlgD
MAISTDPAYMYRDSTITTNSVIQGKDANEMGMDDFFNLLVAQLTNQDMMNPTGDTEFISQMAQFSALQGVKTIQEYQLSSYAASYIGKYVTIANVTETGQMETIVGKVDSITYYDGTPKVVVNGNPYDMFTVMEINNEDGSGALAQALSFVGHDATVRVQNEDETWSDLTGEVTDAGVASGKPYVTIGGTNYSTDMIQLVDGMTVAEFLAQQKLNDLNDPTKPIDPNTLPQNTEKDVEALQKLIGHSILMKSLRDDGTVGGEIYGTVTDVSLIDSRIYLNVNGTQRYLYQLLEVDGKDQALFFEDEEPGDNNSGIEALPPSWNIILEHADEVTASVRNEFGGYDEVTGKMTDANLENGKYNAVIDGVYYRDISLQAVEGMVAGEWLSNYADNEDDAEEL